VERDAAVHPANPGRGTLTQLFLETVDRMGRRVALRFHEDDRWQRLTYREVFDRVWAAAGALEAVGLQRGDRVAILSPNRPEWAIADYGCLCAGVVDVPIYVTLTAEQIAYILRDAGVRLIFVASEEQMARVLEVRDQLPQLERLVLFDPPSRDLPEGVQSWADFLAVGVDAFAGGSESGFRSQLAAVDPEDTATILYTSGTTGDPKGVMLTHQNLYSNIQAAHRAIPTGPDDVSLSFLPLSHVFQRMVDYLLFSTGTTLVYARSLEQVPEDLQLVQPTVAVAVPRIFEKIYDRVTSVSGVRGRLVRWASGVGGEWVDRTTQSAPVSFGLRVRYALARRLVLSKVAQKLGGRLRIFVSGGAPLSAEINRFFLSAGVMILEGYGLTETSPVLTVNSPLDFPRNFRLGTVGKRVAGTEIRIAADGEILARGPQIMKGYFNQPAATAEAIDSEGWFHTGDVGVLDPDGFLRITDRKKDLIITSGGKNVAPQPLENRLKESPFFDQVVLVGDRRPYLVTLGVPDFVALTAWAEREGIRADDRRDLLQDPRVSARLFQEMQSKLTGLASFETPKKLLLLDRPFTVEDGSLTPTQKVKRRVVQERLADRLTEAYEEGEGGRDVFLGW